VRKNTNQTTPRIRMGSPVEMVSSAATDGPARPAGPRSGFQRSARAVWLAWRRRVGMKCLAARLMQSNASSGMMFGDGRPAISGRSGPAASPQGPIPEHAATLPRQRHAVNMVLGFYSKKLMGAA
jgi:hypothetical protein